MRILGISGSLRRGSHNTRLLHASRALLPQGAELDVFDGLAELPPFSEDAEHAPPASVGNQVAAPLIGSARDAGRHQDRHRAAVAFGAADAIYRL